MRSRPLGGRGLAPRLGPSCKSQNCRPGTTREGNGSTVTMSEQVRAGVFQTCCCPQVKTGRFGFAAWGRARRAYGASGARAVESHGPCCLRRRDVEGAPGLFLRKQANDLCADGHLPQHPQLCRAAACLSAQQVAHMLAKEWASWQRWVPRCRRRHATRALAEDLCVLACEGLRRKVLEQQQAASARAHPCAQQPLVHPPCKRSQDDEAEVESRCRRKTRDRNTRNGLQQVLPPRWLQATCSCAAFASAWTREVEGRRP